MNHRVSILAAAALFAATSASAATRNYGVSLGAGHSDNITRAAANEQDETMANAGVDFSIAEQTAKLRALAAADLSYVEYLDDTFDSEVVGNLNAQASFTFIPERFEWFAADNFGQVRSDPFQPVTPDNRENINYFSTGPDLTVHFGSMMRGRLSGRYSKVSYEDSPFDSNRIGGTASLLRDVSSVTSLSFNVQAEKNEYDDNALAANDFDRSSVFLGYETELSRLRANVELGYSVLSRDAATEDSKGLMARVDLRRQLTPRSSVSVRLGREFSDAGSSFVTQQEFGAVDLNAQAVVQTTDPFTNEYASLGWDFNGARTGLSLGIQAFDESYEQQTALDRRRTVGTVQVYRNLTPALRAQLGGAISKEKFENVVGGEFRDTTVSASLDWQAARKLSFGLRYDLSKRSSETALGEYDENRVWLQVRYGAGRAGEMPRLPSRSDRVAPVDAGG